MEKKRLLLHSCCACCASVAVERLSPDYAVECFFCNPNIHPPEEFARRLDSMRKLCSSLGVPLIEIPYAPDEFLSAVRGRESDPERGERCKICFRLRLLKTAESAAQKGFAAIASTLTLSPHKDSDAVNAIGESAAAGVGVRYVPTNLKKKDGYKRSIALSHEHGLYRQTYCGCVFSMHGRGQNNGK
jgi:hypothetical protein